MTVYLVNESAEALDEGALSATARALLDAVGEARAALSLSLVGDEAIRALNREHRGKDAPTDVLSFPAFPPEAFEREPTRPRDAGSATGPERLLGDVVISVETARRQAADYDAPLARELERLLIHAVLHLCGHDHLAPDERAVMEREERRLAARIGMPWPYDR